MSKNPQVVDPSEDLPKLLSSLVSRIIFESNNELVFEYNTNGSLSEILKLVCSVSIDFFKSFSDAQIIKYPFAGILTLGNTHFLGNNILSDIEYPFKFTALEPELYNSIQSSYSFGKLVIVEPLPMQISLITTCEKDIAGINKLASNNFSLFFIVCVLGCI